MSIKSTRKIIAALILVAGLGLGAFQASRALFSDVETLSNNTAGAATVNLKLAGEDPTQVHFDLPNIMPSQPQRASIAMTDIGSGADYQENLYVGLVVTDSDEGLNSEAETDVEGEGELDDCLMLRVSYLDAGNEVEVLPYTSFPDLANVFIDEQANSALDALLQTKTVNLNFDFSADACGNEAMGDGLAFDLVFYYEQ